MDEMLSISLWLIIAFMTVSASVMWFGAQTDFPSGMGLTGYDSNTLINPDDYSNLTCEMTSLFEFPAYAFCFINQLTTPVFGVINAIWQLLTSWQNLLTAIFASVPAGDLFGAILIPFFSIIELGAVIVLLMKFAALIRGTSG